MHMSEHEWRERRNSWSLVALMALRLSAGLGIGENVTIRVDASRPGPPINPRMYGIFLEEINHGVDGGLYGELIRNLAFAIGPPRNSPKNLFQNVREFVLCG